MFGLESPKRSRGDTVSDRKTIRCHLYLIDTMEFLCGESSATSNCGSYKDVDWQAYEDPYAVNHKYLDFEPCPFCKAHKDYEMHMINLVDL